MVQYTSLFLAVQAMHASALIPQPLSTSAVHPAAALHAGVCGLSPESSTINCMGTSLICNVYSCMMSTVTVLTAAVLLRCHILGLDTVILSGYPPRERSKNRTAIIHTRHCLCKSIRFAASIRKLYK